MLKYTNKGREEKTNFSKILPNNQIITTCRIELRTMNEKLTMIGLTIITSEYFNFKRKLKLKFPDVPNRYLQKRI